MKRHYLALLLAILAIWAAGFLLYVWKSAGGRPLTVATWAGAYGHAQISAQISPFARMSGADVRIAIYDGGTHDIARQESAKSYDWDVIDMELPDAVAACRAGLLERVDAARLPPSPMGTPAQRDFLPGAIGPCWVADAVYSRLIAFDRRRFGSMPPKTLADVFDLKKFPGPRALSHSAKYNLEMALLADGVKPAEVYAVLATPAGLARALAKLETIRTALVWPEPGETPAKLLTNGRAAFAAVLNGELLDAMQSETPFGTIWDGQLYEFDVLAVPRGNPRRNQAFDFLRYATNAPALGRLASWVPYGPARLSARRLVGPNPDLKMALTPFQPPTGNRLATALAVDDDWWQRHGTAAEAAWQAWLTR
jgi:putative spermidine/putrescine transport system substrate-binding protein